MDRRALGRDDLSNTEYAYLAGIIDGEGTIGIYKGGTPYSYYLRLIVTNTCFPLMEWVHARIGGSFVPASRRSNRHAQAWQVVLGQKRAALVIRGCLPYLVVKQMQALNGLKFVDEFVSYKGSGSAPSDQEIARRVGLYAEALRLNGGRRTGRPRKNREQRLAAQGASTLPPIPK